MLVERSDFTVRTGEEAAFLAVLRDRAAPLLAAVAGVEAVAFGRGVEHPDRATLLVTWASMAAHRAFRSIPANAELRTLLTPYVTAATMEHYEMEEMSATTVNRSCDRRW